MPVLAVRACCRQRSCDLLPRYLHTVPQHLCTHGGSGIHNRLRHVMLYTVCTCSIDTPWLMHTVGHTVCFARVEMSPCALLWCHAQVLVLRGHCRRGRLGGVQHGQPRNVQRRAAADAQRHVMWVSYRCGNPTS